MKTETLISLLAQQDQGVTRRTIHRRHLGLGLGMVLAAIMMFVLFGLNPYLLKDATTQPTFWLKVFFPLSLALLGWTLFSRIGTPGAPLKFWSYMAALPWLAVALLAAWVLMQTPAAQRSSFIFGNTWHICSISIAVLSAPVFVAMLWAMRSLAPTQLGWAGATSGLLAGAVGASIYALHCPELAVPFVAIWYGLGMVLWAVVGALLGPRLLRW
jgi:hypothetical protein